MEALNLHRLEKDRMEREIRAKDQARVLLTFRLILWRVTVLALTLLPVPVCLSLLDVGVILSLPWFIVMEPLRPSLSRQTLALPSMAVKAHAPSVVIFPRPRH